MKMTVREYLRSYIEETEHGGPKWPTMQWEAMKEVLGDFVDYVESSEKLDK